MFFHIWLKDKMLEFNMFIFIVKNVLNTASLPSLNNPILYSHHKISLVSFYTFWTTSIFIFLEDV